jgi:hypothetical protein
MDNSIHPQPLQLKRRESYKLITKQERR